ncbi:putative hydro-lyase [Brooklawnia cerclae]|uniref:putative hydro-lyase n=1 Tax=Brooklawnia cerclae TaxID=349934 RepID=UPI00366F0492
METAVPVLGASSTPAEARAAFRSGVIRPTAGLSQGHAQANLITLPRTDAADFREFARLNPKPCPLLDVLEGTVTPAIASGADLRVDLPLYRVWRDGELVDEVSDATKAWGDPGELVSFLIGCSFTFEWALLDEGIPVRHITADRNVPMYRTNVPCASAGAFSSPLVVSMRGIPADLVDEAVRVSGRYPLVHGAPVHVGSPEDLGIDDLDRPDYGDAPILEPGDVPVFWACGVTPQAAVVASRPRFAITHAPGHMFISDVPNDRYLA